MTLIDDILPLPGLTFFESSVGTSWTLLVPSVRARSVVVGSESSVALVTDDSDTTPTTAPASTPGAFIQNANSPLIAYDVAGKALFVATLSGTGKKVSAMCYDLALAAAAPGVSVASATRSSIYINIDASVTGVGWRPAATQFRYRASQASDSTSPAPAPSGSWTTANIGSNPKFQIDVSGRSRNRESKIEVQLANKVGFGQSTILTARSQN